MTSPVTAGYRVGASAARLVPLGVGEVLARWVAPVLDSVMGNRRSTVARHQHRALAWRARADRAGAPDGAPDGEPVPRVGALEVRRSTVAAFESYARYWLESFRLPAVDVAALDAGIDVPDYHHIEQARARGNGVILALPHLGGWEWAGFWGAAVKNLPMSVVVEPLEPPDLFEWFAGFRRRLGMNIIAQGPSAGGEVLAALRRNEVVCLLSDRDLAGDGVEVEFMGERTTLPAGPALLSLRSGAPVLPTGVYFGPHGRRLGWIRPPLDAERAGRLRDDVARITQQMADELALLIAAAPHQWHLFGPNWPSDRAGDRCRQP